MSNFWKNHSIILQEPNNFQFPSPISSSFLLQKKLPQDLSLLSPWLCFYGGSLDLDPAPPTLLPMSILFVTSFDVVVVEVIVNETRSDVGICVDMTFIKNFPLLASFDNSTPLHSFSPPYTSCFAGGSLVDNKSTNLRMRSSFSLMVT